MTFKPPSNAQRATLERAQKLYSRNVDAALPYLATRGLTRDHAVTAGLGVVTGELVDHESLKGRLSIPYITPEGVVNMAFRCMQNHKCGASGCPKYIQSEGLGVNLYHVMTYQTAGDFICLAEGELDALTLNVCGIPAFGISGAGKWEKHWTSIMDDFEYVYVMVDGDEGGQKFLARVRKAVPHAVAIQMPDEEDVNSMYVKHGTLYLHERLSKGMRSE